MKSSEGVLRRFLSEIILQHFVAGIRKFLATITSEDRGYPNFKQRIPNGWRVVPTDAWPINTTFGHEENLDLKTWRFETTGEVEHELSWSYDQLTDFSTTTIISDHHCIDGWSYLGHEWTGVRLDEILRFTKPRIKAKFIMIECERGLTQCFPIAQDLLFATKRNGVPLPREGGFPLRAVAPGEYGYKSVKWVKKVKFIEERELDFYDLSLVRWGFDLYSPEENPWNCDNVARKKLLKDVFSKLLQEERSRRIEERTGKLASDLSGK
jgi:DMSO/TMAO reductase YedYZ molybdopterin-dependent catalytic subunit